MKRLDANYTELEHGVSYMEQDIEQIKADTESIKRDNVELSDYQALKDRVVDLGNRSRRNNIVLHNVPEGVEGEDIDLSGFVESFVHEQLDLEVQIGSAHRTPIGKPRHGNKAAPRFIHARCIKRRDRDRILKEAPARLREKDFNGKRVYITDDIEPQTRVVHKKLVPICQEMRDQGKFAYIPFSVPRVIKYRDGPKGSKGPLRTYTLREKTVSALSIDNGQNSDEEED